MKLFRKPAEGWSKLFLKVGLSLILAALIMVAFTFLCLFVCRGLCHELGCLICLSCVWTFVLFPVYFWGAWLIVSSLLETCSKKLK
jgi:hypothetical protein